MPIIGSRHRTLLATAVCIFVGLGAVNRAVAQPTLAELLPKCPPLRSSDEALKTFELAGALPYAEARMEYVWSRTDGYYFAVYDRKSGVPLFVCADKQKMLFDPLQGRVEIDDDYPLEFRIDSEFGVSYFKRNEPSFDVDPGSFLGEVKDAGKWERREGAIWRHSATVERRKERKADYREVADFDPTQEYPLRRLELHGVESGLLWLRIDELRINQPLRRKLKPFPKFSDFPAGLKVLKYEPPKGLDDYSRLFETEIAIGYTGVLDNPKAQAESEQHKLVSKSEWTAAVAILKQHGPALIKLFEREQP